MHKSTLSQVSNSERPEKPSWLIGLTKEMEARQEVFSQTRIRHPKLETLLNDLVPLLMPHSQTSIICLTGATGAGKSTLTKYLLEWFESDFEPLMVQNPGEIPFAFTKAYANGDTRHGFKDLYKGLIKELAEPGCDVKAPHIMVDGKLIVLPRSKDTVGGLRNVLVTAFKYRKTRVVVIDEAAHIMRFAKEAALGDTLKSLSEQTKLILVGSFNLFDLVDGLTHTNGELGRRAAFLNLERYQHDNEQDRKDWHVIVRGFQKRWPCAQVPNFASISDSLLENSLGCIGLLDGMLLDGAAMQMRNKGVWGADFLEKCVKSTRLREIIRQEIELGEKRVRQALYGNCPWNAELLVELNKKLGVAVHA